MSEDKDDVSKEISDNKDDNKSDNNSSESEDSMSIISISEETNKSETSGLESSSWNSHYENIRFAILNIFINSLLHITLVINVSKLLTSK